jgi:hypothetical protein
MKRKTKHQLIQLALVIAGVLSLHFDYATQIFIPLSLAVIGLVFAKIIGSFFWYSIIYPVVIKPINRLFRIILKTMLV